MIRPFAADDLGPLIQLLSGLHARTPYRHIEPDWPVVTRVLLNAAAKRDGFLRVAEHGGRLTGVLLAVAERLWWQDERTGARIASDLAFHSLWRGDGRRLLRQMVDWAFALPRVVRIECAISSGEDAERLSGIYLETGFRKEGTIFVLNHPKYEAVLNGRRAAA